MENMENIMENNYKYVVWVGGCEDHYTTYDRAIEDYYFWIDQGYDDVQLEELKKDETQDSSLS
jgi:hypothetical protein